MPHPSFEREAIEAEIDSVRSLGVDALRTLWRTTFRSSPPPAFRKDLIARFLCWQIQEQAFGGLDPKTAKHFGGLARGGRSPANRPGRLKPGTERLREYQGERHTVTIVPNGYVWHETTYASLSTIARVITGTSWNHRASLGYEAARNQKLRPQTASDVLVGRQSRIRPALHKVLSSVMGSADHEACRSQAATLRDLHPQIDREFNSLDAQREACDRNAEQPTKPNKHFELNLSERYGEAQKRIWKSDIWTYAEDGPIF